MFDIKETMQFAKELLEIPSPTGYTHQAVQWLKQQAESMGYSCEITPKGNLMIHIAGENEDSTLGISGHTDTLGLMVRSITSQGTLLVTNIGGPIIHTLDGEYCTVITRTGKKISATILSTTPSMHVYKEADSATRTIDTIEIRLDECVKNKEDVLKLGIGHGDFVAIDPKTTLTESGFIKSRFLDDKISVAIIFGVLKAMSSHAVKPRSNVTCIISTYEETGHGTSWIPQNIKEMLAIDMGCIGKDLACTEYDVSICAKDSSGPYDYEMVSHLIELAKAEKCNYAVDIYPFYGSDVTAALRGGQNIKGALIGPGVHASHGMERTHQDAIESSMKLLFAYLTK